MKSVLLLFLLALAGFPASPQTLQWARPIASNSEDFLTSSCTDAQGNIYVAGSMGDGLIFGNDTLISIGGEDVFIGKLDPQGNPLWGRIGQGGQDDRAYSISADASGNVFVSGGIGGGYFTWDDSTYIIANSFILKLSPNGSTRWIQVLGNSTIPARVAADGSGNCYVAGSFTGSLGLGGLTLSSSGLRDGFLVKLDSSGAGLWARKCGGPLQDRVTAIAVDVTGNCYVAGSFNGTIQFSGQPALTSAGASDAFVVKYNPSGLVQWRKGGGGPLNDEFRALTALPGGGVYAGGSFEGTAVFGTKSLISKGSLDALLTRYDASGNLLWAQPMGGVLDDRLYSLSASSAGGCYMAGEFMAQAEFGSLLLTSADSTDAFVGHFDSTGSSYWVRQFDATWEEGLYSVTATADGCIAAGSFRGTLPLNNSAPLVAPYSPDMLLLKLLNSANHATGRVFIDLNGNGQPDAGEPGLPEVLVAAQPGNAMVNTDANGAFRFYLPAGSYTISLPQPPLYYNYAPQSQPASFSGILGLDSTLHFALVPVPGQQDVQVKLTQFSLPRAGFPFPVQVSCRNVGTLAYTGNVSLAFSAPLLWDSASTVPGNLTATSATWPVQNLLPGQTESFRVYFSVPVSVPLGDPVQVSVLAGPLAGDLSPADNADTLRTQITGPFDPNDKQVDHAQITPVQVQNGQWLEYLVRFQNVGNAPAQNVLIRDSLSQLLDLTSLEILHTSHQGNWTLSQDRVLLFSFPGIQLPDSITDETGSHGFARYRVKPLSTVTLGEVVSNTANIYFDFNNPVTTAPALTQVANLLASHSGPRTADAMLHLIPNPASQSVNLRWTAAGIATITITDALGRTVHTQALKPATQELSLQGWAAGIYHCTVQTAEGIIETVKLAVVN